MIIRVAVPGGTAFQLRKGEEGISVFDTVATDPPLSEDEILAAFRPYCMAIIRTKVEIGAKGLQIVPVEGSESLPERLRQAHAEIRPGWNMLRLEFKKALKELE